MHQKQKLNELREVVPILQAEKPSTVLILQKSREYILYLKKRLEEQEVDNANLRNALLSLNGNSVQIATLPPVQHLPVAMTQGRVYESSENAFILPPQPPISSSAERHEYISKVNRNAKRKDKECLENNWRKVILKVLSVGLDYVRRRTRRV